MDLRERQEIKGRILTQESMILYQVQAQGMIVFLDYLSIIIFHGVTRYVV